MKYATGTKTTKRDLASSARTHFLFFALLIFFWATAAYADNYTLLESVGSARAGTTATLADYLPAIFKFMIGGSILLAILMLVFAGVEYTLIGVGSEKIKKDAQERFQNAIWGLLIVLIAYLALQIINPKLVDKDTFKIQINALGAATGAGGGTAGGSSGGSSGGGSSGGGSSGGTGSAGTADTASEAAAKAQFTAAGATFDTSKPMCPPGTAYGDFVNSSGGRGGCTTFSGTKPYVIDALKRVKQDALAEGSNIILNVTAAAELGHAGGGPGSPSKHNTGQALDLAYNGNLDSFIIKSAGGNVTTTGKRYNKYATAYGTFTNETGAHAHWHFEPKQ